MVQELKIRAENPKKFCHEVLQIIRFALSMEVQVLN